MCDYFLLPIQEILAYLLEYESILHVRKLYQTHLANSTKRNYLALLQFDLFDTNFYSRKRPVFFDIHAVHQVEINICISHLQVLYFLLDMFKTYLA